MLFYRPIKSAVSNNFFSTYCTEFLKMHYRDIVGFRTKNWKDEKMVIGSLQTLRFPLWRGKKLSDHFQMPLWCNKTPSRAKCQHNYCFRVFLLCLSLHVPQAFLSGEKQVVLVFETIYLIRRSSYFLWSSDFESTAFYLNSLWLIVCLMDRYFCKKISPIWLDNRDVQRRHEFRRRLG